MAEPTSKKRKTEDTPAVPVVYRCEYLIPNRTRTCGMQRKQDNKYCSHHMIEGQSERVPCPLDPKHTVWKQDLSRHLKKCPSLGKDLHDPWYSLNINHKLSNELCAQTSPSQTQLGDTEEQLLDEYLPLIREAGEQFTPLRLISSSHEGLSKRLSEKEHQKHPIQQSSLAGNLKTKGLLGPDNFYIEFGCGKAELSRFLNLCILEEHKSTNSTSTNSYGFGLIDRSVNRMKNDPKITKETTIFNAQNQSSLHPLHPQVKRTRIDIKDLDLDNFLDGCKCENVVGISKHLCGVATDMTLRSLFNSSVIETQSLNGLMIAMCCRHICDYDLLLPFSKEYLAAKGFNKPSFKVLQKVVSWAVSSIPDSSTGIASQSSLSSAEKTKLGVMARRLIDESRVYALRKMLPSNYTSEIFWYVDQNITLENVCLCVKRN
ncbi:tRNA:m4X modification enzyme [Yamadazyma tenuis]|uniref:tRNA:m(4)X modification enzyme TRM13 n=1 Tax=Candida tenuis (strain ATCC 10573 / BCRC 21748 / CBS 615 / JCM 9827 / NBRC 10315 / NRRL Y-1498 / VKM Y-70) TaxID=590646 RepID=G3BCU4_CANTC|nr:uncharacterized protein CANTEDRAFT_111474 [Yamadazyma tenuis ATCC 10573]EGV60211.1 hypothetical protein CANTEDRAFT_111474 [Yamadazyma tenuis ATCC 10573]WEJ94549.1 tRNA:m4X modification enzyme [Yamadazyma tenuis]